MPWAIFLQVVTSTISRGTARIFCWGCTMYRSPKLMKWSMCIMPRSSLPTQATPERATLNRYARTTATFFSMQHSSRQSYAMCHVLIRCWVIAAKLLSKWQTSAVLNFEKWILVKWLPSSLWRTKFHQNPTIIYQWQSASTIYNMAAVRHLEFLKVLIFGRMTVITFNICRGTLNFIGRFLLRDAYA